MRERKRKMPGASQPAMEETGKQDTQKERNVDGEKQVKLSYKS